MKKLLVNFIKKYPITFIGIISFTILAVAKMEELWLSDVYEANKINLLVMAITIALTTIIETSFLVTNIFDFYNDKLPEKIKDNSVLKNLIGALIGVVLYFITSTLVNIYIGDNMNGQYVNYPVSFILISIACYFIVTKKNMEASEYTQKVFINELILLILFLVLLTGTGILFYITNALLGFNDWIKFFDIMMVETILVTYIGSFIAIENVEGESNVVSKVLIKYVMFIMVLIGFIVFYIYLVKIIINKSLPSNQVFLVCTILFGVGLSTALMARSFDEGTTYDKIIEYLPMAFIPALILQIISLTLRIHQYGLTVVRYLGVIIILYELAYIVLYIFKYDKLKYIFIVGAILAFIMTYVPVLNIMQLPKLITP